MREAIWGLTQKSIPDSMEQVSSALGFSDGH